MGSDSDTTIYYEIYCESLATLLAVAIAAFAKQRHILLLLVFVEDEDSRRRRHVVD